MAVLAQLGPDSDRQLLARFVRKPPSDLERARQTVSILAILLTKQMAHRHIYPELYLFPRLRGNHHAPAASAKPWGLFEDGFERSYFSASEIQPFQRPSLLEIHVSATALSF